MDNVNNLNGVSNFGHGNDEVDEINALSGTSMDSEQITTPAEEPEEKVEINNEETE